MKKLLHKYGVELPSLVKHTYTIDCVNKNSMWHDAISREMKNLNVASDILDKGCKAPPGYKKANGDMIFDIYITFERNA